MQSDVLAFVRQLLEMNSIPSFLWNPEEPGGTETSVEFDRGLRSHLGGPRACKEIQMQMADSLSPQTVQYYQDTFGCYYVLFPMPEEKRQLWIGPYLLEMPDAMALQMLADENAIPPVQREYYYDYMKNLTPVNRSVVFRNLMTLLASWIYGGDDQYRETFGLAVPGAVISYDEGEHEDLSAQIRRVEERFAIMNSLLDSVRRGNDEQALRKLLQFRSLPGTGRFANPLKEARSWLIIFNTQLRGAAQDAGIHPYDLSRITREFAFRIDALTSEKEQPKLMQEMIRKYCMLIRNQNLSGYSGLIQQALLRIRLGIDGELSLRRLAEELSVNPSYLSAQFSKEVGMPMMEYINRKRIETSMQYLNDPNIPIKEIIVRVGIFDLNYYARLFRRYVGMSPTEYRRKIQEP